MKWSYFVGQSEGKVKVDSESAGCTLCLRPVTSGVCAPVRGQVLEHMDGREPAGARHRPAGHDAGCSCRPRAVAVGLAWRPPVQRRVRAHLVVEVDPPADDPLGIQPVAELMEVHRLVLQRPPWCWTTARRGRAGSPARR